MGPRLLQERESGLGAGAHPAGAGRLGVGQLRQLGHSHRRLQPPHAGRQRQLCDAALRFAEVLQPSEIAASLDQQRSDPINGLNIKRQNSELRGEIQTFKRHK